jgi:hypothetical protein
VRWRTVHGHAHEAREAHNGRCASAAFHANRAGACSTLISAAAVHVSGEPMLRPACRLPGDRGIALEITTRNDHVGFALSS